MKKYFFLVFLLLVVTSPSMCHPASSPRLSGNNRIIALPNNQKGLDSRSVFVEALDEAKSTIDLAMYDLRDRILIQHLAKAYKRGVKIRIINEQNIYLHGNNIFKEDELPLITLTNLGIEVKPLPPYFITETSNATAHYRFLIVDKKRVIITTANWDAFTFRQTPLMRNFAIILTAEKQPNEVKEIADVFEADWNRLSIAPTNPNLVWGPHQQSEKLQKFMSEAKESITIYQQSFNDPDMTNFLQSLAERGIKIRLLMTPYPFGGHEDTNNRFQEQLLKAGGEVKLSVEMYIHAKIIIVDNKKAYIGSCNFWPQSLKANRELGYITDDVPVIQILRSYFENDWQAAKSYRDGRSNKRDWN
jgi:cardiolipin synthase